MTFGTLGCRPRARSVLHCHGVLALRHLAELVPGVGGMGAPAPLITMTMKGALSHQKDVDVFLDVVALSVPHKSFSLSLTPLSHNFVTRTHTHAHTCSEIAYRIIDVECIVRAQTLQ